MKACQGKISTMGPSSAFVIILLISWIGCDHSVVEKPIGLIVKENSDYDDKVFEQAFDFATMVINNNLLNRKPAPEVLLNPIVRNRTDTSNNFKLGGAICSVVNEGVLVIMGSSRASSSNTIKSYSQALRIPFVMANSPRSSYNINESDHFDISVGPPYIDAVMRIIANLTISSTKIFYVYDSDDGLWRLQKLYQYFQTKGIVPRILDAFRIRDIVKSYILLRNMDHKAMDNKTIVLDLSSERAYNIVLERIIDVGMNRENYHYILANADAMDLNLNRDFFSQFLYGGVKITGFRLVDNRTTIYRKWEQLWQQNMDEFPDLFPLKTGSALMIDSVSAVHEALRITKDSRGHSQKCNQARSHRLYTTEQKDMINAFDQVQFEGLTGIVALKGGRRSDFKIDVFEMQYKQKMEKIDTWEKSDLTIDSFKNNISEAVVPNVTQRVTSILVAPFTMKKEKTNGVPIVGTNALEGYCMDLIEKLSRMEGFEYSVTLADEYGDINETSGEWTGMIGLLIQRKRDIAVAPLSITEERERVVDFSKPFMNTGISIMIKKPEKVKPGVFSFMDPLDSKVWLCIAIGFLAVSFVLFFVGRFSPYEWNVVEDLKERTATTIFSISNTLWFSLGALMQQGSDISPRSFSGRIVGSAWWFFTLIIISSYTANLAAFLTIEKLVAPIDSADDLVDHPHIKYGTKSTGTSWRFFEDSSIDTYKKMRKAMMENSDEVLFTNYDEGVRKVRDSKGDYAFLLESAMNSYHAQQEPCDTMMVGDPLDNKGYGVATYIDYPLRHNINIAVLTLEEKGELIKLQQKWWLDKGQCGDQSSGKESTGTQSALTLSNVSGIFHILIGGLVLAMLTSSIEYMIQKQRRISKRNSATNDKPSNRRYKLPIPPPPPPTRRACYSSRADMPAGTGPAWENGYSNEPAGTQDNFPKEPDDFT